MYAVGFINLGDYGMYNPPCWDGGLRRLHSKTLKDWNSELQIQIMKKRVDVIFVMSDFTQKMWEMNQAQLWEYCYRNKIARIK